MMKTRILVIDDELTVRQTICDVLEASGYSTEGACDGEEGLQKYKNGRFDLVITDIVMPNKEGIETIREIRQQDPACRIIAMSGRERGGILPMAKKLGASGTLTKPFTASQLLETLAGILKIPVPVPAG